MIKGYQGKDGQSDWRFSTQHGGSAKSALRGRHVQEQRSKVSISGHVALHHRGRVSSVDGGHQRGGGYIHVWGMI